MTLLMTTHPRALDTPDDLPSGLELGRCANVAEALERFDPDLVRLLGDHTLLSDEYGYRAFLAFKDQEKNAGWRMFEQALEHGLDSVDDPAPEFVEFFNQLERVPEWVDFDQIHRGAVAFWRAGPLVPMVIAYSVIAKGFTGYGASRPVLFSGRMIDRDMIGQRLLESFRWITRAYTPGKMVRDEDGFKHTARVRMIHATVRHVLSRSPEWDWHNWGIPINNLDAVDTPGGQFGVEVVDSLMKSGVKLSDQEREDIFALNRYIGYVIGVPEEILHVDEEDARVKHAIKDFLEPPTDEASRKIVRGIIDYGCEESLGGYDVLPPALAKFMTVQRRKNLSYGMMCFWQPPSVQERLGVEPNGWTTALKVARPVIAAGDTVTRRFSPDKDEARAMKTIAEFEVAIAMGEDEKTPLAEPEQLAEDTRKGASRVQERINQA